MSRAPVAALEETLHAKARLGIMTLLAARGALDFQTLKGQLGLTDGNLGAHLRVLEEARYVTVRKSFVDRRPRTTYDMTAKGRAAFRDYLDGLEEVIREARGSVAGSPGA